MKKYFSICEIEDFVGTHICELRVILGSRVLRGGGEYVVITLSQYFRHDSNNPRSTLNRSSLFPKTGVNFLTVKSGKKKQGFSRIGFLLAGRIGSR